MKYKQLTREQFEELHEEFANFLATQQIDAKEWAVAKEENPKLVEEELNLFSDTVWEEVLQNVNYLEHFSNTSINLFKCEASKVYRIVVQANKPNFSFLNTNDYQWFIDNTKNEAIEFFKGEKSYSKERNMELFNLIEKGSVISNGELYESVITLIK